ncbi:MAG TPA: acyl-CoA dehydrogenase [Anaerolineae bacterium]|nr:acyl-CoA dehydrogenase [Anaerolineae bacterium]
MSLFAVPGLIALRRQLISAPVLAWLRRRLPPLSATEREALEAGDIWWEAELLSGRPDWNKLLAFPLEPLSAEEQAFLDGPVNELCQMLDDWHIVHERRDLPPEVWDYIRGHGFFGLVIPKRYGGLEFSARAHSEIVLKIASRSLTAAVTVMVPNSLGPGELIRKYGTEQQREHYLPRLARGEEIPCFALTAPEAGSDAGSMVDAGIVCEQGGVLGIRLNWHKRYITLAPVATLLGLAFKLSDPDHLLGDRTDLGITLALIPTDTPGVEIGQRHDPMGIPFQNGPTRGRDVFIPIDQVIGGRAGVGKGWRMLMECLAEGRGVSLPALSAAATKLSSRATGAYARVRHQFHVPIGRFEGIEEVLGRIGGLTYLIDAARRFTLGAIDSGVKPAVASAILKYHTTEAMRRIVNDAMDVHGGKAIMQGPRNHLDHMYQAIPISITVEGANILTRNMIIYGQGAIRCHPFLLEEMQAAEAGDLERFDRALFGHLRFFVRNGWRALWTSLLHGYLAHVPKGPHKRPLQHLSRLSAVLAFLSDLSLGLLGGELNRRERISARLGDVLSHLYLASALIRLEPETHPEERPLLDWALAWCLHQAEEAVAALLDNYPFPWLGWALKHLLLPWRPLFPPPDDRLDHVVAQLLQAPSPARDRLTSGIFLPEGENEPLARLEQALKAVIAAEPIQQRLRQAVRDGRLGSAEDWDGAVAGGIITAAERDTLAAARDLTAAVIAVDAFPPERFAPPAQEERP